MNKKGARRLLAMLLSLVMLVGAVPVAFAAEPESGGVAWEQVDNSAVTARPRQTAVTEEPETPLYADDEVVRVSIVLEAAPTVAVYSAENDISENAAAMSYRQQLLTTQEYVAEAIAEEALDPGEKLDVVYNLTLVANVISANVAYGEIEKIKAVEGVEDVVVATRYSPDVVSIGGDNPQMEVSSGMTGASIAWTNGYTGAGMRVAIIDTGLDVKHQSFDSAAFDYAIAEDAEKDGVTVASYDLLDKAEIAEKLDQLNAFAMYAGLGADDLYVSSKIPFGFNYVDRNLNVEHLRDVQGAHGSHVAGIAAANRYLKQGKDFVSALDTIHMVGNAPDAQVLVMKVFGQSGGAYPDDYVAAIEDAIILGCDTVNLSLGSNAAGMAYDAAFSGMLESLNRSGTVVTISAGNNGAWADETSVGNMYADDVNYQTGGSPGSYTNSLGVASVDNDGVVSPYFTVDGKLYSFTEGSNASNKPFVTLDTTGGEGTGYDYIFIDGMGDEDDYTALGDLVKGKIVFCSRGSINFSAKAQNAFNAGAAACVVYNNAAGTISMTLSGYTGTAPCVSISQTAGAAIRADSTAASTEDGYTYYTGELNVFNKVGVAKDNSAYQTMSSFSSWGVPGDLSIKPEITAPGGGIFSLDGTNKTTSGDLSGGSDKYILMSGTSMAAPQMAGIGALVKQAIERRGISQKGLSDRALAQSLMMSTATPLTDEYDDYYSVLQQGAGLVNADAATAADSYVQVKGQDDGKVKVELGDDPAKTGTYSFTFTIQNLDGDVHGYNLSADVFTQAPGADSNGTLYMLGDTVGFEYASVDWTIDGKPVERVDDLTIYDFDGDGDEDREDAQALLDYVVGSRAAITNKTLADFDGDNDIDTYDVHLFLVRLNTGRAVVPANSSVTVTCTITLDQAEAAELLEIYPNGFYVEAYAKIDALPDSEGAVSTSHSIPVLGFYGNWSDASMFDKGGYVEYGYGLETRAPYLYNGQTITTDSLNLKSNVLLVRYAGDSGSYYFGVNPYVTDETYMPERAALNNQRGDVLASWKYSAIRTPAASRVTATNVKTGKVVLDTGDMGSSYAAYWYATNNAWQNVTSNARLNWSGAGLEEGDTVELKLTLAPELYVDNETNTVNWDALGEGASRSVQVTIDNTAPAIKDVKYDAEAGTLTVTASDNQYVAAAFLINRAGTTILDRTGSIADIAAGAEGTYTLTLPEGNTDTDFMIQVCDYADNASTWKLTLNHERGDATSITVSPAEATIFVGGTTTLTVTAEPWDAADTFDWVSDTPEVATVDANGVVTGVAVGKAIITVYSHTNPAVTDTCEVTVKTVVADLNGIVWGTDSKPDWSTFNTATLPDYTAVRECGLDISAATQTVDGKIFAAVLNDDGSDADIYAVDNELNATRLGNVNAGIGVVDLEDSPNLGYLVGVYGRYILFLNKETGEMVDYAVWGDGSSSLVGIAYAGSVKNTYYNKMIDMYYLVDSSGMVYFDAVIELEGVCYDFYPQSTGKGLVASTGYTAGDFYSSLLYAADNSGIPYLFWSRYNGSEVQDLIAIDVDDSGETVHLGEFADKVWPVVGLMSDLPAQSSGETTTALVSAVANTAVEKTGIEPAGEALTYRGPAGGLNSVEVGGTSGSAYEVKVDSVNHTVTVPVVASDSTNGLFTVSYDANVLTFKSVTYGNVLHSAVIDTAKGQVKVGYADAESYTGLVANLVFTYGALGVGQSTKIGLVVAEDGTAKDNDASTVIVSLPSEVIVGPTQPTQPTNPDKPTDPKKGFDDVKQGDWFYDEVTDLADKGYINGVSDNLFAPNQNLSRGMLVTILYRMDGEKAVTNASAFSDVVKDSWYEKAVNWAAANGIVYGYDDGRFGPNDMVTRQQMAAILWRYAQYKGLDVAANGAVLPDFPDRNEIATWAGEAVSWAYSRGVMTGKTGGKLDPNGNATRAEAAVMLYRFLKLSPKGDKQ